MTSPLTVDQAQNMLVLADARINALLDENKALKAQPSQLFTPRSPDAACRQFEREAFAQGLHLAAKQK